MTNVFSVLLAANGITETSPKLIPSCIGDSISLWLENFYSSKQHPQKFLLSFIACTGCSNAILYDLNSLCDLDFELWINLLISLRL